eukprot:CAMPEP_0119051520 /NCGR_PEP_ID=MMETSP1177-20130426/73103_1 /TAXON_ID=2985 /ORGANISM="Ochromonas sp, Strain CCMP1899" /LENGTH=671 /DNA_ID=CAMNT_0007030737 /DNA_START=91 /DNA_END=2106 /DNA_ORIENTATION=+
MKDYKSTIFFFLWAVTSTILLVYKNRLPSSDVLFDKNDRRAVNAIEKKVVSFRESTLQGINDTSARYAAQKWHGGSPTDLFKGSCYCGDEDKYCMCTPSLAIDAIIEIHHSSEKTATIRNRGLRIEDQEEDHGEDLLPSGRRNLESEETTGDLEGDEDERYQNNNKKDHKRRNRNHKQKQGRKREAEDSGFDNRRMLDEEEGEEQEYKFHGKYGNDNKKDHNRRNHNNKQKKALKRPSGGLESEYMESPRRLQEDEASENDEFVEKHHNNNEKDHKRRNHNHKQKNARNEEEGEEQEYKFHGKYGNDNKKDHNRRNHNNKQKKALKRPSGGLESEYMESPRRLQEDEASENDEFVEKHHNNNEKDHKRRNHNHKQKNARKKALKSNQDYEEMAEVERRLQEDEVSENDEFVEKHHNNNEKDHKRRNHNHKQKNARKKALKSNQDYEENIMSEETEVKRRLDEDNDEFVEKHHNNNEKDHKRRNHNHKQKDARKKALNQNYEAMEVGTEVTRRLEEVNDESNRYLKSDGEKIMADKISTVGGEANSLKNISLVLVLRRDPPANTYAIPGGFVTVGETLEETVTREVKEETNLDLFTIEQFKMYSDPNRDKRRHTVSAVFRCIAIDSKALKKGDDAKNVALVPLRDVLKMPLAFDHKVVLTEYIKKYHNYILT